jgi:plasmid segregation protein ParM
MKVSAFGVDIGYGHTKGAFRTGTDISTVSFPSLAPLVSELELPPIRKRVGNESSVVLMEVQGSHYAVGPGVESLSVCSRITRTLFDSFCLTPMFAALLGGALHSAGVTDIECMVLGLPAHLSWKYSRYLRDAFTGALDFGQGSIHVRSAKVVPPLLGSLRIFSDSGDARFDPEHDHLLIDVGYSETNWLLYHDHRVDDHCSGSVRGGAWQVYRTIGSLIANQERCPVDNMERIGRCLGDKRPLLHYGKDIDLASFLERLQAVVNAAVAKIRDRIHYPSRLRSVVLTGGGASLYETAVRAAFPRTRIDVLDTPSQANAKGFVLIGEAVLAGRGIVPMSA